MFCKYCGKEIPEGATFCGECGNTVSATTEAENNDAVVAEEVQTDNTPEQTPFAEPQFNEPAKKSNKTINLFAIAAVAVVVVVLIACFGAIKEFFIKNFSSDAAYFRYAENKTVGDFTDEVSEAYGMYLENLETEAAADATIKLNVGDDLISLIEDAAEDYLYDSIDLDWINNVTLDMGVNLKDNVERILTSINVDGEAIVDMDMIMDMENGEIFYAFPLLSDKYLKMEYDMSSMEEIEFLYDPEFRKVLPSEEELDKLLDKYINIIFENLDNVEKDSGVLEISGIEQKLTALEIEISQEDAINIAIEVLETAKKDKQLKTLIEDISKYLEKMDLIYDADDVYDEFCEAIDEGLDSLEDQEIYDDEVITLIDYVNSDLEVVGRKIETEYAGDVFHYATVRDGKKFAYELVVEELVISGEGTEKGNTVNGEYSIEYYGDEICDVVVTDFKTDSDYLNGKIRITPSSEILEFMGLDSYVASAFSIVSPALELNFDNKKGSGNVEMNLVSGEEVLLGFTISSKETKTSKVKMPDSADVCDVYDDYEEWVDSIDVDGLLDKLDDLGIPTYLFY